MFFKNLIIYRFTKEFTWPFDELDAKLGECPFRPIEGAAVNSLGWSAPLGDDYQSLVQVTDKYWMLCLTEEQKILPGDVVNAEVNERAKAIEKSQQRKVSRKERQVIKEEVLHELLPKAFARRTKTLAYICPSKGYLVINAASKNKADVFTSMLRKTIGSLPVRSIATKQSPNAIMSSWLNGKSPREAFTVGSDCELNSTSETGQTVRYKNTDLDIEQIREHLADNMLVTKLAVDWNDELSCVLNDDLSIKRLKYSDLIQDRVDDIDTEDAASQFDASFYIMADVIDRVITAAVSEFGGEEV